MRTTKTSSASPAADLVRERPNFLYGWEFEGGSKDDAQLARKRVEYGRCLRPEMARAVVDTVQVQVGLVSGVGEDMLL